jgi:hypothetical protein
MRVKWFLVVVLLVAVGVQFCRAITLDFENQSDVQISVGVRWNGVTTGEGPFIIMQPYTAGTYTYFVEDNVTSVNLRARTYPAGGIISPPPGVTLTVNNQSSLLYVVLGAGGSYTQSGSLQYLWSSANWAGLGWSKALEYFMYGFTTVCLWELGMLGVRVFRKLSGSGGGGEV